MNQLEYQAERVAEILKLIGHPKRLLILCQLSAGPQNVGQLEKSCTVSQSQLSQFLTKMKSEGLLEAEKSGSFVTYRIADTKVMKLLESLHGIYCS